MLLKCDPSKGGCSFTFEINSYSVEGEKYIQCPKCGRFIENPFYDESEEVRYRSYLGCQKEK